jgi:3-hydroxybutyrate dehydrogenase
MPGFNLSPIEDFPNEMYEKIIAINMNAVFYAGKAAWKYMKKEQRIWSHNISSVHGIRASEFKSAYVTAQNMVLWV